MKKPHVLLAVFPLSAAMDAGACDVCAIYCAPLGHHVYDAGLHVGVAEQFTHFGTIQVDGKKVSNEFGQRLDSSVSQVAVGYQLSDRFGVQFNLPVIYRSFRRLEEDVVRSGTESGIGDAALLGNFVMVRKDKADWSVAWQVFGGVKFPTGDSDRLREELEEGDEMGGEEGHESAVHGHDLTLGSGSYDGIIGTEVYSRWRRLFFAAGAQYALRSRGDFDYEFADDLTWSGGPGAYLVFNENWVVGLQANVSGEHKKNDVLQGEKLDDTALTAVYLGPQATVTWKGRLTAEVGVAWPVYLDNSALQIVPDYRVTGGLSWRF